ncbi:MULTISPECIES: DSD1 family PLP-dependent enzyme [unclassified Variovorax]|uniref:DSD1 family PLP-dependent enzyme n=1 Tax=unclassified Variovorax TaxID=663243 RepID=UPI00076C69F4|nr:MULTISPECIES: DSD1 family PLP-dependent enzyme [unclassified Variovorax]KWT78641.1 metal-activated pyridoxal enzyme [Variovorax sp. WDL1]PNG52939.1 D-threo-3-hydroxyaspartate dehydratase [Variovorax sp. B2]PNG53511.1 D-threo-3-hydroxyaspartate dehydratase [Variovorax sp. B4]VTV10931.1 D-threo-3-hydroxyaspartate dehydratase [Variovorax sp. WDL1]
MQNNPRTLADIDTPAAIVSLQRMQQNIARMQQRANALGVRFRPHVKTSKCAPVVAAQLDAGATGITVSTLKEADQFFGQGVTDILYAVGMAPHRLAHALELRQRGCALQILTDSVEGARAIAEYGREHGHVFEVLIEIDSDGHRSGIEPADDILLEVGRVLHEGGMRLAGVLTHAGSSYELHTPQALAALAEQERAGCVLAAERLRAAGLPCPIVSVGSTPTALEAASLEGVTELRAGVYVFFDLVMRNVGVCSTEDIALSVLTTVIGHQAGKGWAIVDAGWMAMSRDRGTARQQLDCGYGQVCTMDGVPLEGYLLSAANQEHGILSREGPPDKDIVARFPTGTRLRILPNHACATGAQFPAYEALAADGTVQTWERFHGW